MSLTSALANRPLGPLKSHQGSHTLHLSEEGRAAEPVEWPGLRAHAAGYLGTCCVQVGCWVQQ